MQQEQQDGAQHAEGGGEDDEGNADTESSVSTKVSLTQAELRALVASEMKKMMGKPKTFTPIQAISFFTISGKKPTKILRSLVSQMPKKGN